MNTKIRQHGFTLVELIIALLILSVVMALCASGFKFGTRVWNSVDIQSERIDTLQAVQGFVRRSMSSALIQDQFVEDDVEKQVESLFIGDADRIRYVSYSPKYGVDDYLYQYDFYLDHETKKLQISYRPYNKPAGSDSSRAVSTLLEGVEDIRIEYFSGYEGETDNEGPWASYWNSEFTLPLLVKINLVTEDKQNTWPELVIQTRNGPYVIR